MISKLASLPNVSAMVMLLKSVHDRKMIFSYPNLVVLVSKPNSLCCNKLTKQSVMKTQKHHQKKTAESHRTIEMPRNTSLTRDSKPVENPKRNT